MGSALTALLLIGLSVVMFLVGYVVGSYRVEREWWATEDQHVSALALDDDDEESW